MLCAIYAKVLYEQSAGMELFIIIIGLKNAGLPYVFQYNTEHKL